jgi:hypothetical protein
MQSDRAIGRYRLWYGRLLRLYPRPFRQRFAEPMAQTFTDLARERREANRGLIGFAAWAFAETSAGIIRENVTHMFIQTNVLIRWVLITAAVLAVPLLAMVLNIGVPDPGSGTGGVNWGPLDFAIIGALVLAAGLLYEFAASRDRHAAHRAAVGIAVGAGLLLIWVNLAVGIIGDEGNPANLMYLGVLAVGFIGAVVARLQPGGMARAMFAMALAQALVAFIALVAGLPATLALDAVFVSLWLASALLFRRASAAPAPAG